MGIKTRIEYADSTINPTMGCDGCELWNPAAGVKQCYAGRMIEHYAGRRGWPASFDKPQFFPGRIETALNWPDLTGTERPDKPWLNGLPRLIFIGDMGDIFTEGLDPYNWLPLFIVEMEQSPHIWLFLTKRPARMAEFFSWIGHVPANFWLGTTVTQSGMYRRLRALCGIVGVTVRWASFEPLLGPVEIDRYTRPHYDCAHTEDDGTCSYPGNPTPECHKFVGFPSCQYNDYRGLDWVVCGAETGQGARPMHLDWARWLRDQAEQGGVSFFLKKLSDGSSLLDGETRRQMPEWKKQ